MLDSLGYLVFLLVTILIGLAVLILVRLADKDLEIEEPAQGSGADFGPGQLPPPNLQLAHFQI